MGPVHKKLLGTWQSDKRRTLATFRAYEKFPPPRKRAVAALFGKLQLRYTPKFCYITLDGETFRDRYDVIAEDADSIVLMTYMEAMRKKVDPIILEGIEELFAPRLDHLHFETLRRQEYYWAGQRSLVEWFKKVDDNQSMNR